MTEDVLGFDISLNDNYYRGILSCKNEFFKFIIGKNGRNIDRIRYSNNVKIQFPKRSQITNRDEIRIEGKREDVLKAKKELEQIIATLSNAQGTSTVETTVLVPCKYHSYFSKRIFNEISKENNGVKIKFLNELANGDLNEVSIKGAKEFIVSAKLKILEIVNNLEQQTTHEIKIDSKYHGCVIGARAQNLVRIEQMYNVRIVFPKRVEQSDGKPRQKVSNLVQIHGKRKDCEMASHALIALVPNQIEFSVPFEYHKYIIGKGGSFLRQLQDQHNVTCKIPKAEEKSNLIVLIGMEHYVQNAKQSIEMKIKELEKQNETRLFTAEINAKTAFMPKIIGKQGATFNYLRTENGVHIKVSEEKSNLGATQSADGVTKIIIKGLKDKVEASCKKINDIIKTLESNTVEKLEIDPKYYARIIGTKGKVIDKITKDLRVDIDFSKDTKLVTITGFYNNVANCKKLLLKMVEIMNEVDEKRSKKVFEESGILGLLILELMGK